MLQCVAVCCSVSPAAHNKETSSALYRSSVLQCVAVFCSMLQCVAVCCSVLQCGAARYSALQCGAVWGTSFLCVCTL